MSEYGIKPYSKAIVRLLKGVVEKVIPHGANCLLIRLKYKTISAPWGWSLSLKRTKVLPLLNK